MPFFISYSPGLLRLLERNEAPERETVVESETYIAAFLFAEEGNLVPNNEVVANIFAADDNFRLSRYNICSRAFCFNLQAMRGGIGDVLCIQE